MQNDFERKKSVLALACEFEREVFSAYKKFVRCNRLLLSYSFSAIENDEVSPELLYMF